MWKRINCTPVAATGDYVHTPGMMTTGSFLCSNFLDRHSIHNLNGISYYFSSSYINLQQVMSPGLSIYCPKSLEDVVA